MRRENRRILEDMIYELEQELHDAVTEEERDNIRMRISNLSYDLHND